jgi:hypothetical protein
MNVMLAYPGHVAAVAFSRANVKLPGLGVRSYVSDHKKAPEGEL